MTIRKMVCLTNCHTGGINKQYHSDLYDILYDDSVLHNEIILQRISPAKLEHAFIYMLHIRMI